MPGPRELLAIPARRSTWRRIAHLMIGGALAAPYLILASFAVPALEGGLGAAGAWAVTIAIYFVVLPIVTGMLSTVRELEVGAASRLLGVQLAEAGAHRGAVSWSTRWRSAAWFVAHLVVGLVICLLALVVPPAVVSACTVPFATGDVQLGQLDPTVPGGPGSAWIVPLALLSPVALVYLAGGAGVLLMRAAPRLLGPSPAERLATLERQAVRLAERNRLARELHDSVGHALSIVTVQAGAAGRVLESDPAFARQALIEIETSARDGLRDLDHVLGLLRDDRAARAPSPTLADLQRLVAGTRSAGIEVTAELTGRIDDVPQAVSREAYRIVQESLTNVARHAGRVPVNLCLTVDDRELDLELTNPLDAEHPPGAVGGGRGLSGIHERVTSLHGEVSAGPDAGCWRVAVRLPLHPRP